VLGLKPSAALYWRKPKMVFEMGREPDDLRFMRNPPVMTDS